MRHPSQMADRPPLPPHDRRPDPNSLLIWWPKVADLHIPMPETIVLDITSEKLCGLLDGVDLPVDDWARIDRAAEDLGYPVFMRTDLSSGKHDYRETCHVESRDGLRNNLWRLIEANMLADVMGLPFEALVLREHLTLASTFTAFRGLPIAPERRYFVRDGVAECWHAYWPEGAISHGRHSASLPNDWRGRLEHLNRATVEETAQLTRYAQQAAGRLGGYWSVDFAFGRRPTERAVHDERWWLIDAARGERSWHPEDCPVLTGGV